MINGYPEEWLFAVLTEVVRDNHSLYEYGDAS